MPTSEWQLKGLAYDHRMGRNVMQITAQVKFLVEKQEGTTFQWFLPITYDYRVLNRKNTEFWIKVFYDSSNFMHVKVTETCEKGSNMPSYRLREYQKGKRSFEVLP